MMTNQLRQLGSLVATLGLMSCATSSHRGPQSFDSTTNPYVTPTAGQLFLVGKFNIKKSFFKFFNEDHYGEEMDLSMRRPAVNLHGTVFEQKYGQPGFSLIANFYHKGQFYIARVPDRSVKDVSFHLAYFPPKVLDQYIAAHSLLRFEMEPDRPIELVALMPTEQSLKAMSEATPAQELAMLAEPLAGPDYQIRNAAVSAEAQWTKNDPSKSYDLIRGTKGAFIQIVRFESINTRLSEMYEGGNPTTEIHLDLPAHVSGDQILAEALRTSEHDGLTKLYDTFWYNCTTLAFDIVERAEGVHDERLGFIRSFLQKRVPIIAPEKLQQYGGIDAIPLQLDESLAKESFESYTDVIARPMRAICPADFSKENCTTVKQAISVLKKTGKI